MNSDILTLAAGDIVAKFYKSGDMSELTLKGDVVFGETAHPTQIHLVPKNGDELGAPVPLHGPKSRSMMFEGPNMLVWGGQVQDIMYKLYFVLSKDNIWFWRLKTEGQGECCVQYQSIVAGYYKQIDTATTAGHAIVCTSAGGRLYQGTLGTTAHALVQNFGNHACATLTTKIVSGEHNFVFFGKYDGGIADLNIVQDIDQLIPIYDCLFDTKLALKRVM
jgi:hypothetical protein